MTISGDDYEDRRRRATATERGDAPAPGHSERELVAQGYVRRGHYDFTAIDHTGLYAIRRYEHPNIPDHKEIRQGREDGSDWLKPYDGVRVPFRWPELHAADPAQPVYWTEGEKDAETLARHGLVATTAAGQRLSATIVKALRGFHVVVLADKDSKGEENAEKAVEAFRHYAASVRVVRLPRLQRSEDVTDWLDLRDGTIDELKQIVESTPPVRAEETLTDAATFLFQAHATISRREWLYRPAYIRSNVSVTAGAGARGKSTLIVNEALAMASGKPLLGVQPSGSLRVWYVNLEDDMDELKRKFNAAATFHELTPSDIADRLYVDSGTLREIVVATEDLKRRAVLNHVALEEIRRTIIKRSIDVVIFDPFVSLHRVPENDNGSIDLVVKALARLAQDARCSMMLVHHTRKPNGDAGGVDDARGASALTNAARYVRVLNPMTADEATKCNVDANRRSFYFSTVDGKTNLTPPAESRDWYRLESVELGNGGGFEDEGDNVGVVARFVVAASEEADRLANLTEADVRAAFRDGGPWRHDKRATMWAGHTLAAHLGLGAGTKAEKDALDRAIGLAIRRGWLLRFEQHDASRQLRAFVRMGQSAPVSESGAEISEGAM